MNVQMLQFCPCCFADEDSGSWNHIVIASGAGTGHCANCGNGSTVVLPQWAIAEIRRNASWVGKRYYPADEDRERAEERSALLALVHDFPGRSAERFEDHWNVRQKMPNGRDVSTLIKADSAAEAMRACGLTYVPSEKLP